MATTIRRSVPADAPILGDICYRAFRAIAETHNYAPDFPDAEFAIQLMNLLLGHEQFYGVAAESGARVLGSNFLDERNPISGIGPITVDPAVQDDGVGRALMQAVIKRSEEQGAPGVRLTQAGYHRRSLALYLKLGFEVREVTVCLQGAPIGLAARDHHVRAVTLADLPECNRLCRRVHGHERGGELIDAIESGEARLVERGGRITGYATPVAFFGHAVAETNDDLKALIGTAESIQGPGVLVPARNGELVRWCLGQGLRITQTMTLMTIGLYNEPDGVWLPSATY